MSLSKNRYYPSASSPSMSRTDRRGQEPPRPAVLEDGPTNGLNEKRANGTSAPQSRNQILPTYKDNGHKGFKHVQPNGESGRVGFNPMKFVKLIWKSSSTASSWTNILWPFVPAAIALHFVSGNHHVWTFAINYVAMVPSANLLGYSGQEFARKLPKVAGILIETTLGATVEIVLFIVLIVKDKPNATPGHGNLEYVLQAAILGSMLTNLLLCLGCCFLVGGMKYKEQTFHAVISEAGSGILLVAGFALVIPSAFFAALKDSTVSDAEAGEGEEVFTMARLQKDTIDISHGVSIILIVSFIIWIVYNAFSHDNIFNEVLEADEERDRDRHRDLNKEKLTMIECFVAIALSLTLIALIAIFLVEEIEYVVKERHVPDNFLGLILVPLVEKFAHHLTAIDCAFDNQINYALFHCIAPTIQTALFNAPLVVIISWGLGKSLDLNFEIFMIVLVVLSILVVGSFLRDGSSNYLEGALLVIVYLIIALTSWYYPNAELTTSNGRNGAGSSDAGAKRMLML